MKIKRKFRDYKEKLLNDLKEPELAKAYLNESLMDEDPRLFLIALKNVADAQGIAKTEIARKTKLNRENIYRMLSNKGNPKFVNMVSLLNAVGYSFEVCQNKK